MGKHDMWYTKARKFNKFFFVFLQFKDKFWSRKGWKWC